MQLLLLVFLVVVGSGGCGGGCVVGGGAKGGVTNDLHKTNDLITASVVILTVMTCRLSWSITTHRYVIIFKFP